jgi:hypothetical protein
MSSISITASTLARVPDAGRGKVGDILRKGVFGANTAGIDRACLASLRKSVIAGIKVFALLKVLG